MDVGPFYEAAAAAADRDDWAAAYEYYCRIVEMDARQYEAWEGKAVAGLYAGWRSAENVDGAAALTCFETALLCYDGRDRARYESALADRAGAAAEDLFGRVVKAHATDRENLEGCFALLKYWEAKGTREEECWRAIVAAAESPLVPSAREPGTIYLGLEYPYRARAQEYAARIRAKYEPAFTTVYERGAEEQKKITRDLKRVVKVGAIILGAVIATVILVAVVVLALGAFGLWTYLRG